MKNSRKMNLPSNRCCTHSVSGPTWLLPIIILRSPSTCDIITLVGENALSLCTCTNHSEMRSNFFLCHLCAPFDVKIGSPCWQQQHLSTAPLPKYYFIYFLKNKETPLIKVVTIMSHVCCNIRQRKTTLNLQDFKGEKDVSCFLVFIWPRL